MEEGSGSKRTTPGHPGLADTAHWIFFAFSKASSIEPTM
jgi:hypothetical protein